MAAIHRFAGFMGVAGVQQQGHIGKKISFTHAVRDEHKRENCKFGIGISYEL